MGKKSKKLKKFLLGDGVVNLDTEAYDFQTDLEEELRLEQSREMWAQWPSKRFESTEANSKNWLYGIQPTVQTTRPQRYSKWTQTAEMAGLTSYGEFHLSEILPGKLWQSGNIEDPKRLAAAGINYIINMCGDEPVHAKWSGHFNYPLTEVQYAIGDGNIAHVNLEHIHEIAEAAADHINRGGKVLSHCQMGWNRSGLVTALIMHKLGFEGDVVQHIRSKRSPHALTNSDFHEYVKSIREGVQGVEVVV